MAMRQSLRRCRKWISMVEVRADLAPDLGNEDWPGLLAELRREKLPVIWTVRWGAEGGAFQGSEEERRAWISKGESWGADYVDVEAASPVAGGYRPKRAGLVLSHHDFTGTPEHPEEIVARLETQNPHTVKVAFKAGATRDLRRVLGLYRRPATRPLVAIAMGEWGEASRLLPAASGLPWTYAMDPEAGPAAPGQFAARELSELYRIEKVSPRTRLFCVIGNPVAHSLSPLLHNRTYAELGLDALYARVRVDDFQEFLALADILGLQGASVTIPHKEAAAAFAAPDSWVRRAGAANTLARQSGGAWKIENTDVAAALVSLREALAVSSSPRVLVLGAGGVARSLVWGLIGAGYKVAVAGRTRERAAALARETGADLVEWKQRTSLGFDAVLNGTPVGMSPKVDETPLAFPTPCPRLVAFDTVYTPEETLFLKLARASGARTLSGRGMFWRQAALQHALWFGGNPPNALMQRLLAEAGAGEKAGK